METMLVYVDDAEYALKMLQPMLPSGATHDPERWILIGCAPHFSHDVSKWVSHDAMLLWRQDWADGVFAQIVPLLQTQGDPVSTQLASGSLCALTDSFIQQYGEVRVLDARRPKFGQNLEPVTSTQPEEHHDLVAYTAALVGAGLLVALN